MKIGDKVIVRSGGKLNGTDEKISAGLKGTVISVHNAVSSNNREYIKLDTSSDIGIWSSEVDLITNGGVSMLKALGSDLKGFLVEHKSAIYMIAVLFLADHILFQGAFRERLHGLMNKLLGKVEAQIDNSGKTVSLVQPEVKI